LASDWAKASGYAAGLSPGMVTPVDETYAAKTNKSAITPAPNRSADIPPTFSAGCGRASVRGTGTLDETAIRFPPKAVIQLQRKISSAFRDVV